MKKIFPGLLILMLTACAVPDATVKTGALRPTLSVKGAPEQSLLYVDALVMGPAAQFNGEPQVLLLEEGAHTVEVKQNGATIHKERVVLNNGESRAVIVNTGAK